jgi:hypothetical protein
VKYKLIVLHLCVNANSVDIDLLSNSSNYWYTDENLSITDHKVKIKILRKEGSPLKAERNVFKITKVKMAHRGETSKICYGFKGTGSQ